MTTATTYRYHLPHKAVKADCPNCGPKHRRTLSRYVDAQTGEPLPESYGRCDREANCGYHLSPYHKTASGLSYAEEIYLVRKQEIASLAPRQQNRLSLTPSNGLKSGFSDDRVTPISVSSFSSEKNTEVACIPQDEFGRTLTHYQRNQFAQLLTQRFGEKTATNLLHRFQIGTSARWPGASIFWYVDEVGRVRGGQIKLFADDWHTAKYTNPKGVKKAAISWVHTVYAYRCKQRSEAQPDWLTAYVEQHTFSPCLFGLPQLASAPAGWPVAIVEAPKTAVLCSVQFPDFIWLAVGALSYLNAERLAPLKGRTIVLFPDLAKDGKAYARWSRTADELREQGFTIEVSDYLERQATDEDRLLGLDMADYLLRMPALLIDEGATAESIQSDPPVEPMLTLIKKPPDTRLDFPVAPLAFDADEQLRRVRWCVIPPEVEQENDQPEEVTQEIV